MRDAKKVMTMPGAKVKVCDLYQTWYTGSTRWEMHNGMTMTWIQGQGHRDLKVAKSPKFKVYLLRQSALAEVDRQSPYGTNFCAYNSIQPMT